VKAVICEHRYRSRHNGYLYCRKHNGGIGYCALTPYGVVLAFECPLGYRRIDQVVLS
jgi:hypothetical protein